MSISGSHLVAEADGNPVDGVNGWDADEGGDALDATTGLDRGWEKEDMGVKNLHVTVKGIHDISTGSYAPVRRGTILTNVRLFRNLDDATPAYEIAEALVVRSRLGAEVKGRFEFSFEFHSRGEVVTYNDPS